MRFNNKNVVLPTPIPDPYNDNDYIEFPTASGIASSAYFDTNIHLKNTYKIEIKLKPTSNVRWSQIIGCDVNGTNDGFSLYTSGNTAWEFGQNFWDYNRGSWHNKDNQGTFISNAAQVLLINVGTGDVTINGTTYSGEGNNANGTSSETLMLGGYVFRVDDPGWNGKIYYAKVYDENDQLICYARATAEGFIDAVSGNLLTKYGSGSFTYGTDN